MVYYHAVKLMKLDKDGKANPRTRTYGLIEIALRSYGKFEKMLEKQRMVPHLFGSRRSPKRIGREYGYVVATTSYDPSTVALSFKAPCDIIICSIDRGQIYEVEDFPTQLREEFYKGMFEAIGEYG